MEDLRSLIICAQGGDLDAYGTIVRRFQDMAVGYAYSILGDFHLAQDAAQEAFIEAYHCLPKLREPEAFSGWFRRIIFKHCDRLTRGKHPELISLESAVKMSSSEKNPAEVIEEQELKDIVLTAIRALPEKERLVTSLFYINGYSHQEIAAFLEIPATTVNHRLRASRKRLKERLHMLKDSLQERRPSKDETFVEQVKSKLRPLVERDWESIRTLAYTLEPECDDIELWLRNRKQFDETHYSRRRYIEENASTHQVLGLGFIEQDQDPEAPHRFRLELKALPEVLRRGVGDSLFERLMADLRSLKAASVWVRKYAHETDILDFLKERGFVETNRIWDLRLSVAEADLSPLLPVSEQMSAGGIVITTLEEERQRDSDCLNKLLEFWNGMLADEPQPHQLKPFTYDYVVQRLSMPHIIPKAYFIAKHGDRYRYVGMGNLRLIKETTPERPNHTTNVRRQYRNQGIETTIMMRAIEYAQRHNYPTICAFVTNANTAALEMYEKWGFHRHVEMVVMEKTLATTTT